MEMKISYITIMNFHISTISRCLKGRKHCFNVFNEVSVADLNAIISILVFLIHTSHIIILY